MRNWEEKKKKKKKKKTCFTSRKCFNNVSLISFSCPPLEIKKKKKKKKIKNKKLIY